MQLLKTNEQMMDMIDEQLAEIWSEVVSTTERVSGPQSLVDKLSQFVTQLLRQKRAAEIAIAKLVEVLGSRVFLTGKLTDDAVQFVNNQLRLELEASQVLVERVKVEKIVCNKEDEVTRLCNDANESLLRQQLQDNEQELQSSRVAVAQLKDELAQQKEITSNKQKQLEQVLEVKLREIDALCNDVDLPVDYERTKTTEGVFCYRRKGSNGNNELEDPRVPIALKLRCVASSAAASACVDDKEAILKHDGITSSGKTHHLRGFSAIARDFAARDNIMRRSSSSPHITHDSNVLADIPVPPDDGRKHTIEDFSTPLPAGWEMRVTASGGVFFLNKYTTTTTWTDPRLLELAPTFSSADNDSSQQRPLACNTSTVPSESRPSRSNSATQNAEQIATGEEGDGVQYIDVVFGERGPIGIHFQANVPDLGATVRSLLPDMAAAKMDVLEPYDELVAVNKNAVDSAPFRHVMLLLQGGLRPLTLTFKRDLNHSRRPMSPVPAAPSSDGEASLVGKSDVDEEIVFDEGTVVDLEKLRVPVASCQIPAASEASDEEDMNVADKIITNIFSLFWKPPETTEEEVQAV
ncbi:hypothetical protein DD237_001797 [Peronospora effusa]|uniref:WW domain-containing protein n=1 Tax=Peronospora effusa TaxID=542832 RepID=A0A425CN65_9STRA|nr:hypothetical protein DD237_001797 [Peronospora effusa]